MKNNRVVSVVKSACVAVFATTCVAVESAVVTEWKVVVNNGWTIPEDPIGRTFNSYNQPSVNVGQRVVFRARSRGGRGGQPAHGVYSRDMASVEVVKVLDRNALVPEPNNTGAEFIETPSFPRIDIVWPAMATRGNHPPVWDNGVERAGTTGIYTDAFGDLITGVAKLGSSAGFSFWEVPEAPGTVFDVFPGAPAITGGSTLVFKGNYTADSVSRTGVYFRHLANEPIQSSEGPLYPAGGDQPVVLIANTLSTLIPGTAQVFGSTAPPSAAGNTAVFAGFDNEMQPTLGGIYLARLEAEPVLEALVRIGDTVPGEQKNVRFNRLGEAVSYDGRFVAFWGAWGQETRTLVLRCGAEGSAAASNYCEEQHPDGYAVQIPVHQGIFVRDIKSKQTRVVAKTPDDFDDFVFWNFSGRVPGVGEGDDDGEAARWRSATFVAVSGLVDGGLSDANFHIAFKARRGEIVDGSYFNAVDGIYLRKGPGSSPMVPLIETGMLGTVFDPEAVLVDETDPSAPPVPLPVTEMGIERDGFRGRTLVINAAMGTEEAGWAGIYLTEILTGD